jgi:uncharacterized membrane protein
MEVFQMSMPRFAAGIGAAALVAAMSLPVTALAAPAPHHPMAAKSASTDISSARRGYGHAYRGGYRHYGYRGGYRHYGYRGYPAYGYGGGYGPYYGGPHAYVSLPFVGFSIW